MFNTPVLMYKAQKRKSCTVLVIIKLTKKCGLVAVPVKKCFAISPCFAIFKNVVHGLEPGETPNYSASHQALNYLQLS